MKWRLVLMCAGMALVSIAGSAQTPASNAASAAPVEGIWRCDMNGLPAMTLTVTDEGGSLTGAVLFYLHRREPGQAETATAGVPEPLLNLKLDGNILTFQVSHRRAHPPESLDDQPVNFQLKLDGPNKAEFINSSEPDPNRPRYVLTRTDY